MNTRWQIACAWCGPAALFVFFVGFATAGFFPPMRPDLPLDQVVAVYAEHATAIRLGTFVMLVSSGLVTPFAAALSLHLRRTEDRRFPVLSLTQFAAGHHRHHDVPDPGHVLVHRGLPGRNGPRRSPRRSTTSPGSSPSCRSA